jgi:NaMN:DMB phosphoribosyltransferase
MQEQGQKQKQEPEQEQRQEQGQEREWAWEQGQVGLEGARLLTAVGGMSGSVLDLGRDHRCALDQPAQHVDLGPGTADSRFAAAMDSHQLDLALSAGRQAVERAKLDGISRLWAQGAGLGAELTNQAWWRLLSTGQWASGPASIGSRSMARHADQRVDAYQALRCMGGFEHAALVGSALAAAQLGLRWRPIGETAVIAMLLARSLNPSVQPWLQADAAVWLQPGCAVSGCCRKGDRAGDQGALERGTSKADQRP